MCNLYSQRKPREELRGLFKVSHNRAVEVEPQAGIFPGYMALRTILLASAMAATFVGRRANSALSQGRCLVPWILA